MIHNNTFLIWNVYLYKVTTRLKPRSVKNVLRSDETKVVIYLIDYKFTR